MPYNIVVPYMDLVTHNGSVQQWVLAIVTETSLIAYMFVMQQAILRVSGES